MVFVGFVEGSKAVRYWDKKMRNIKVSRNFAFNENEEPGELEVREVPGLQAEGESRDDTPTQTTSDNTEITQDTSKTSNEPKRPDLCAPGLQKSITGYSMTPHYANQVFDQIPLPLLHLLPTFLDQLSHPRQRKHRRRRLT
jgi:hypothetical protein